MRCLFIITFLGLALSVSGEEYSKFIKEPHTTVYAAIGQDLRLQWTYRCSDNTCKYLYAVTYGIYKTCLIYRDVVNEKSHYFLSWFNQTVKDRYVGRISLTDGTFVIMNFTKEDAVTYVCKLLSSNKQNTYSWVNVKIAERPKFISAPKSTHQQVKEGENFSLNCAASGKPAPVVSWYKEGKLLTKNTNESTYSFMKARTEDSGVYVCEAHNAAGKTSWATSVIIDSTLAAPFVPDQPTVLATIVRKPTSEAKGFTENLQDKETNYSKNIAVGVTISLVLLLALMLVIFLVLRKIKGHPKKDRESYVKHRSHHLKENPKERHSLNQHNIIDQKEPFVNFEKQPQYECHLYDGAKHSSEERLYASADYLKTVDNCTDLDKHTYAQVDKTKKRRKGELLYTDLDHSNGPIDSIAPRHSGTQYADILIPVNEERTYENVETKIKC